MRVILWLVGLGALVWCGYWVLASRAAERGAIAALDDLRLHGQADYEALSVSGFPARFDFHLAAPAFASADGRYGWAGPEITVHSLSYRPNHIIAEFPAEQRLRLGLQTLTLDATEARASATLGLGTTLPLDHAEFVGKALAVSSDLGWAARLDELRLALRGAGAADRKEIGAELLGLALPSAAGSDASAPPARVERARLDAVLALSGGLELLGAAGGPRLLGAEIRALEIDWGQGRVRGSGQIEIDRAGRPQGRIALTVQNWRPVLKSLVGAGAIRPETAPTWERGLAQLAAAQGDGATVSLPLVFRQGWMSLGPIPIGPAPVF